MDLINPQIFTAKVMHKRFFPKENSFNYGVYYLALPLPSSPIKGGFASFHPQDVGHRNGSDPSIWAREILQKYHLSEKITYLTLLTMPKVLGYIFNPVSFYLCHNEQKDLLAVIAEVHNTFGEQHTYLCYHHDLSPINNNDILESEKVFHVSPFLERNGFYQFRFHITQDKIAIWIDYFDKNHNKQLITSLIGNLSPLNEKSLRLAFWKHPLVTFKAITLIHWQAIKLILKRIKYINKPEQNEYKVTIAKNREKDDSKSD
jgi:DUF1365 family protein